MNAATPQLSANAKSSILVCCGFALFVSWDQWYWWHRSSEHAFGFLVPVFAMFVIFQRGPIIGKLLLPTAPPIAPGSAYGSDDRKRSPVPSGWQGPTADAGFIAVSLGGLFMFTAGAVFRANTGPTVPSSLLIAAGFAGILIAMAYFNGPSNLPGDKSAWRKRAALAGLFVFPAGVWLLSIPPPGFVLNIVSRALLDSVVAVVLAFFDFLAMPVEREGSVLLLPRGRIGVAEACSGIRSLTGCIFAGSFLAAVFLEGLPRKVFLLLAAAGFAVGFNILRSGFLTAWAFHLGPDAVGGIVHDLTAFAVFGLTCLGLVGVLALSRLPGKHETRQ